MVKTKPTFAYSARVFGGQLEDGAVASLTVDQTKPPNSNIVLPDSASLKNFLLSFAKLFGDTFRNLPDISDGEFMNKYRDIVIVPLVQTMSQHKQIVKNSNFINLLNNVIEFYNSCFNVNLSKLPQQANNDSVDKMINMMTQTVINTFTSFSSAFKDNVIAFSSMVQSLKNNISEAIEIIKLAERNGQYMESVNKKSNTDYQSVIRFLNFYRQQLEEIYSKTSTHVLYPQFTGRVPESNNNNLLSEKLLQLVPNDNQSKFINFLEITNSAIKLKNLSENLGTSILELNENILNAIKDLSGKNYNTDNSFDQEQFISQIILDLLEKMDKVTLKNNESLSDNTVRDNLTTLLTNIFSPLLVGDISENVDIFKKELERKKNSELLKGGLRKQITEDEFSKKIKTALQAKINNFTTIIYTNFVNISQEFDEIFKLIDQNGSEVVFDVDKFLDIMNNINDIISSISNIFKSVHVDSKMTVVDSYNLTTDSTFNFFYNYLNSFKQDKLSFLMGPINKINEYAKVIHLQIKDIGSQLIDLYRKLIPQNYSEVYVKRVLDVNINKIRIQINKIKIIVDYNINYNKQKYRIMNNIKNNKNILDERKNTYFNMLKTYTEVIINRNQSELNDTREMMEKSSIHMDQATLKKKFNKIYQAEDYFVRLPYNIIYSVEHLLFFANLLFSFNHSNITQFFDMLMEMKISFHNVHDIENKKYNIFKNDVDNNSHIKWSSSKLFFAQNPVGLSKSNIIKYNNTYYHDIDQTKKIVDTIVNNYDKNLPIVKNILYKQNYIEFIIANIYNIINSSSPEQLSEYSSFIPPKEEIKKMLYDYFIFHCLFYDPEITGNKDIINNKFLAESVKKLDGGNFDIDNLDKQKLNLSYLNSKLSNVLVSKNTFNKKSKPSYKINDTKLQYDHGIFKLCFNTLCTMCYSDKFSDINSDKDSLEYKAMKNLVDKCVKDMEEENGLIENYEDNIIKILEIINKYDSHMTFEIYDFYNFLVLGHSSDESNMKLYLVGGNLEFVNNKYLNILYDGNNLINKVFLSIIQFISNSFEIYKVLMPIKNKNLKFLDINNLSLHNSAYNFSQTSNLIFGGNNNVDVKEECIELYIRLPLLCFLYYDIFIEKAGNNSKILSFMNFFTANTDNLLYLIISKKIKTNGEINVDYANENNSYYLRVKSNLYYYKSLFDIKKDKNKTYDKNEKINLLKTLLTVDDDDDDIEEELFDYLDEISLSNVGVDENLFNNDDVKKIINYCNKIYTESGNNIQSSINSFINFATSCIIMMDSSEKIKSITDGVDQKTFNIISDNITDDDEILYNESEYTKTLNWEIFKTNNTNTQLDLKIAESSLDDIDVAFKKYFNNISSLNIDNDKKKLRYLIKKTKHIFNETKDQQDKYNIIESLIINNYWVTDNLYQYFLYDDLCYFPYIVTNFMFTYMFDVVKIFRLINLNQDKDNEIGIEMKDKIYFIESKNNYLNTLISMIFKDNSLVTIEKFNNDVRLNFENFFNTLSLTYNYLEENLSMLLSFEDIAEKVRELIDNINSEIIEVTTLTYNNKSQFNNYYSYIEFNTDEDNYNTSYEKQLSFRTCLLKGHRILYNGLFLKDNEFSYKNFFTKELKTLGDKILEGINGSKFFIYNPGFFIINQKTNIFNETEYDSVDIISQFNISPGLVVKFNKAIEELLDLSSNSHSKNIYTTIWKHLVINDNDILNPDRLFETKQYYDKHYYKNLSDVIAKKQILFNTVGNLFRAALNNKVEKKSSIISYPTSNIYTEDISTFSHKKNIISVNLGYYKNLFLDIYNQINALIDFTFSRRENDLDSKSKIVNFVSFLGTMKIYLEKIDKGINDAVINFSISTQYFEPVINFINDYKIKHNSIIPYSSLMPLCIPLYKNILFDETDTTNTAYKTGANVVYGKYLNMVEIDFLKDNVNKFNSTNTSKLDIDNINRSNSEIFKALRFMSLTNFNSNNISLKPEKQDTMSKINDNLEKIRDIKLANFYKKKYVLFYEVQSYNKKYKDNVKTLDDVVNRLYKLSRNECERYATLILLEQIFNDEEIDGKIIFLYYLFLVYVKNGVNERNAVGYIYWIIENNDQYKKDTFKKNFVRICKKYSNPTVKFEKITTRSGGKITKNFIINVTDKDIIINQGVSKVLEIYSLLFENIENNQSILVSSTSDGNAAYIKTLTDEITKIRKEKDVLEQGKLSPSDRRRINELETELEDTKKKLSESLENNKILRNGDIKLYVDMKNYLMNIQDSLKNKMNDEKVKLILDKIATNNIFEDFSSYSTDSFDNLKSIIDKSNAAFKEFYDSVYDHIYNITINLLQNDQKDTVNIINILNDIIEDIEKVNELKNKVKSDKKELDFIRIFFEKFIDVCLVIDDTEKSSKKSEYEKAKKALGSLSVNSYYDRKVNFVNNNPISPFIRIEAELNKLLSKVTTEIANMASDYTTFDSFVDSYDRFFISSRIDLVKNISDFTSELSTYKGLVDSYTKHDAVKYTSIILLHTKLEKIKTKIEKIYNKISASAFIDEIKNQFKQITDKITSLKSDIPKIIGDAKNLIAYVNSNKDEKNNIHQYTTEENKKNKDLEKNFDDQDSKYGKKISELEKVKTRISKLLSDVSIEINNKQSFSTPILPNEYTSDTPDTPDTPDTSDTSDTPDTPYGLDQKVKNEIENYNPLFNSVEDKFITFVEKFMHEEIKTNPYIYTILKDGSIKKNTWYFEIPPKGNGILEHLINFIYKCDFSIFNYYTKSIFYVNIKDISNFTVDNDRTLQLNFLPPDIEFSIDTYLKYYCCFTFYLNDFFECLFLLYHKDYIFTNYIKLRNKFIRFTKKKILKKRDGKKYMLERFLRDDTEVKSLTIGRLSEISYDENTFGTFIATMKTNGIILASKPIKDPGTIGGMRELEIEGDMNKESSYFMKRYLENEEKYEFDSDDEPKQPQMESEESRGVVKISGKTDRSQGLRLNKFSRLNSRNIVKFIESFKIKTVQTIEFNRSDTINKIINIFSEVIMSKDVDVVGSFLNIVLDRYRKNEIFMAVFETYKPRLLSLLFNSTIYSSISSTLINRFEILRKKFIKKGYGENTDIIVVIDGMLFILKTDRYSITEIMVYRTNIVYNILMILEIYFLIEKKNIIEVYNFIICYTKNVLFLLLKQLNLASKIMENLEEEKKKETNFTTKLIDMFNKYVFIFRHTLYDEKFLIENCISLTYVDIFIIMFLSTIKGDKKRFYYDIMINIRYPSSLIFNVNRLLKALFNYYGLLITNEGIIDFTPFVIGLISDLDINIDDRGEISLIGENANRLREEIYLLDENVSDSNYKDKQYLARYIIRKCLDDKNLYEKLKKITKNFNVKAFEDIYVFVDVCNFDNEIAEIIREIGKNVIRKETVPEIFNSESSDMQKGELSSKNLSKFSHSNLTLEINVQKKNTNIFNPSNESKKSLGNEGNPKPDDGFGDEEKPKPLNKDTSFFGHDKQVLKNSLIHILESASILKSKSTSGGDIELRLNKLYSKFPFLYYVVVQIGNLDYKFELKENPNIRKNSDIVESVVLNSVLKNEDNFLPLETLSYTVTKNDKLLYSLLILCAIKTLLTEDAEKYQYLLFNISKKRPDVKKLPTEYSYKNTIIKLTINDEKLLEQSHKKIFISKTQKESISLIDLNSFYELNTDYELLVMLKEICERIDDNKDETSVFIPLTKFEKLSSSRFYSKMFYLTNGSENFELKDDADLSNIEKLKIILAERLDKSETEDLVDENDENISEHREEGKNEGVDEHGEKDENEDVDERENKDENEGVDERGEEGEVKDVDERENKDMKGGSRRIYSKLKGGGYTPAIFVCLNHNFDGLKDFLDTNLLFNTKAKMIDKIREISKHNIVYLDNYYLDIAKLAYSSLFVEDDIAQDGNITYNQLAKFINQYRRIIAKDTTNIIIIDKEFNWKEILLNFAKKGFKDIIINLDTEEKLIQDYHTNNINLFNIDKKTKYSLNNTIDLLKAYYSKFTSNEERITLSRNQKGLYKINKLLSGGNLYSKNYDLELDLRYQQFPYLDISKMFYVRIILIHNNHQAKVSNESSLVLANINDILQSPLKLSVLTTEIPYIYLISFSTMSRFTFAKLISNRNLLPEKILNPIKDDNTYEIQFTFKYAVEFLQKVYNKFIESRSKFAAFGIEALNGKIDEDINELIEE